MFISIFGEKEGPTGNRNLSSGRRKKKRVGL
jgi:hypothetical protein